MQRRIQVHVRVHGDLRTTSFRSMLQREAGRLGVRGWVRFQEPDDGGAEAVFNGPEGNVMALVRWCERGPLGPRVSEVGVERMDREAFFGFDVRG